MIFRATLILLGCTLMAAQATTSTYQRFESFDSTPRKNWQYFHANQLDYADGGVGGFFFPKPYTAYYADTNLNGFFRRGTPLKASGHINLHLISVNPNYTNSVYIGHFRKGSTKNASVNIVGIALTGNGAGAVLCQPVVQFSNGRAFVGGAIKFPVSPNTATMDFSYTWNPTGGVNGLGQLVIEIGGATSTLTLNGLSGGIDYTLNAFGIYQPAFVQPNSNSYLIFYIGGLRYTALTGLGPRIHVKTPKKIITTTPRVAINGTARIPFANRITAVRYRIIRNGKIGRYKTAIGIHKWAASVRVPPGISTIEITAIGDNGRIASARRTVTRVP